MAFLKAIAPQIALALGGKYMLRNSPDDCLTTVLFHKFVFNDESVDQARERLKIQCDWLRRNFTPLNLAAAYEAIKIDRLPPRALLITIDDAHVDVAKVADVFESFNLPIIVFVCAAWCADVSQPDDDTALAQLVSAIEWYNGPPNLLRFPCGTLELRLEKSDKREMIDSIIANHEVWRPYLSRALEAVNSYRLNRQRRTCTWQELTDLHKRGVEVGCHSVTHMNLAEASQTRLAFEIHESKRILIDKFGRCDGFAYPFGVPGSFSPTTSEALTQAGFPFAFITRSDFASSKANWHELPRIALPDRALSFGEFRARIAGGGVVISNMRDYSTSFIRKANVQSRFSLA